MTEKIKVPQFVADFIEDYYVDVPRSDLYKSIFITSWDKYVNRSGYLKVKEWVEKDSNFLKFVTAVATDDYEVEEEKEARFYWRKKEYGVFSFESIDDQYLNVIENSDGGKTVFFGNNGEYGNYKTKLTTQEVFSLLPIRDIAQLETIKKVED